MKILIVGGAGYLGSALIPNLIKCDMEIDVVDLLWFGNHLPGNVSIKEMDLFELTERDLEQYDVVLFLAGLSNDPMAEFSPQKNFIYNSAAPAFLGYISKNAGVKRLIYAGSCSVYGYAADSFYDETSPTISDYPYGQSKLLGEHAVLQLKDENFSVVVFRQGTICGYSPRMRYDLVVNTMFKTALNDGKVTVNNPAIWRPILSIEDAMEGYISAITADGDISGIYNLASDNYTVGEIANKVIDVLQKKLNKSISLDVKQIEDYRNYKVAIDKVNKVLNFNPQHDVESITLNLLENIDHISDFDNPEYYNIKVFKRLVNEGRI